MIFSSLQPFIVFHTPKTGGTSVEAALTPHLGEAQQAIVLRSGHVVMRKGQGRVVLRPRVRNPAMSEEAWKRKLVVPPWLQEIVRPTPAVAMVHKHTTVAEAKAFFTPSFYQAARKIAVIRHPYARVYSAYRFKIKTTGPHDPSYGRLVRDDGPITFGEYLETGLCHEILASRPQSAWVDQDDPRFRVIRGERLAEDLSEALGELGFAAEAASQVRAALQERRLNVSSAPDEWTRIGADERRMIQELYRDDFERLGFDA